MRFASSPPAREEFPFKNCARATVFFGGGRVGGGLWCVFTVGISASHRVLTHASRRRNNLFFLPLRFLCSRSSWSCLAPLGVGFSSSCPLGAYRLRRARARSAAAFRLASTAASSFAAYPSELSPAPFCCALGTIGALLRLPPFEAFLVDPPPFRPLGPHALCVPASGFLSFGEGPARAVALKRRRPWVSFCLAPPLPAAPGLRAARWPKK